MGSFLNRVDVVARRWLSREARQKTALRQKALIRLLSHDGRFGVMSAYGRTGKHENQVRHGRLVAELQKMGHRKMHPMKGQWEGVAEKSILIPDIAPSVLFALGRKYDQDSVIYKSTDGVIGMYYPSKGVVEIAVDSETVPKVRVGPGNDLWSKPHRDWSFEFGFLWGKFIPWDGQTPVSLEQVHSLVQAL